MKSLCWGLELAHDWCAWGVNRASWGWMHQLIQTGLRHSLESKHHSFKSLCLYSHQPGLREAQQEGVCFPPTKLDVGKNYSCPSCGAAEGAGTLPSKSSLSDTVNLVLWLLSLYICVKLLPAFIAQSRSFERTEGGNLQLAKFPGPLKDSVRTASDKT